MSHDLAFSDFLQRPHQIPLQSSSNSILCSLKILRHRHPTLSLKLVSPPLSRFVTGRLSAPAEPTVVICSPFPSVYALVNHVATTFNIPSLHQRFLLGRKLVVLGLDGGESRDRLGARSGVSGGIEAEGIRSGRYS